MIIVTLGFIFSIIIICYLINIFMGDHEDARP